jgi:hypothetical protein
MSDRPMDQLQPREGAVCASVAVALCLEELDRMKAMQCLPSPAALLERLHSRTDDFNLLAGVAGAYLASGR